VTVLYRGDLSDTATLVGLAQTRTRVGLIAFTGELSSDNLVYCELLSRWLITRGLPQILIHPNLRRKDLEAVLDPPNKKWGWGIHECKAAIRLAGLQLPPGSAA
jgi:hypothetical protein